MRIDVLRKKLRAAQDIIDEIMEDLALSEHKEYLDRHKELAEFSSQIVEYMIKHRTAMDIYSAVTDVLKSPAVNSRETFAQKLKTKLDYLKKKGKQDPDYLKKLEKDLVNIAYAPPGS